MRLDNDRTASLEYSIPVTGEAELQREYELGEVVSVDDVGDGIVAAFVTENFDYPAGAEDRVDRIEEEDEDVESEEIEASEENPVYIVALMDGGSIAVTADEISGDASIEGDDGETIEGWDDISGGAGDADLSPVYQYCDDPHSVSELRMAKKKYILDNYSEELTEYVSEENYNIDKHSVEELVNIPGVDDPHVGFDELPPGWTRKSVLQAWASLGGMWRTCYARMIREMGPNFAKRWCSAMKDEVLRTEEWRGKF